MSDLVPTGGKAAVPTDLKSLFDAAKARVESNKGRLVFGFDATASRAPAWNAAMELQRSMFGATSQLEVQLAVFFGYDLQVSHWETDPQVLTNLMNQLRCEAGNTQIERLLQHI